ncbi:molybdopterin synthase sulfur carrier subunit [Halorubrum cibi]|uniref:Molybdopterin synthase sulfur carrier subunit n=1 Tax=Halorubrum cibi TaxID=413815 RepID=A0A521B5P5_9EURY|nr:molybdopterin synthase sulfur carrier subunit [Halorubrum cibi]
MELELRFFATFREAAGGKTVVREFPDGSDVGDVLRALEDEYDGMDGRLIVDGELAPQINVLKNGREVLHLQGLDTDLADGDRLSVFPPVAGGTTGTDAVDSEEPASEPPAERGWVRREVAYRGISRRLAAHYLENLGGELVGTDDPAEATRVDGDGWRATLSARKVTAAASIRLTEVTVSFAGEEGVLEELLPKFERKAMRAGG